MKIEAKIKKTQKDLQRKKIQQQKLPKNPKNTSQTHKQKKQC